VVVRGLVVYGQSVTVGAQEEMVITFVLLMVEVVILVESSDLDGTAEEIGQIVVYVETVVVVTGFVVYGQLVIVGAQEEMVMTCVVVTVEVVKSVVLLKEDEVLLVVS